MNLEEAMECRMKIPAKFKDLIEALESGLMEYSDWSYYEEMESRGIKQNEVDECWDFLDYLYALDEIQEQKTCVKKNIKNGKWHDIFQCTNCGAEFAEHNSEVSIDYAYCPYCGAKVVK